MVASENQTTSKIWNPSFLFNDESVKEPVSEALPFLPPGSSTLGP